MIKLQIIFFAFNTPLLLNNNQHQIYIIFFIISNSDTIVNLHIMTAYLSILILGLAILGLSIGVIFDNKPIQGSCGGIGADESCTICGGDPQKCETPEVS